MFNFICWCYLVTACVAFFLVKIENEKLKKENEDLEKGADIKTMFQELKDIIEKGDAADLKNQIMISKYLAKWDTEGMPETRDFMEA